MKKRIHMKPELVMVLIAMVSALALMGMLIACIPYYYPGEDADPEALLQHQRELEQAMEIFCTSLRLAALEQQMQ